jgi:hypothetical protein
MSACATCGRLIEEPRFHALQEARGNRDEMAAFAEMDRLVEVIVLSEGSDGPADDIANGDLRFLFWAGFVAGGDERRRAIADARDYLAVTDTKPSDEARPQLGHT